MSVQNNGPRGGGEEPIAIVGSGLRFPGSSTSPSKLWDLLLEPRDLLTRIPANRFNASAFHHPDPDHHGTTNITQSYFLDQDHRRFDANFFNIKAVEVPAIDPQQRLLMEVVYESLEAAGQTLESLAGSQTGVYVGLMCADYQELINSDANSLPTYTATGNARSIMSNRISFFFDWHGPSMSIDTACSSSLVAVHQAVQLLRSGDSRVAVAAGANMILGPLQYVGAAKLHMLSADSRSRMWDAEASGYARGEGVAAVVLKRLSDAIDDGDRIECVIRGSGLNQDGRSPGITMPSASAQRDLIARTYAKARLDPRNPVERCQYFEAHGTGTPAGDPKEAEAMSQAFFHPGESVKDDGVPLYVGSIKTVIGHTEGTAGLAGLIKASLAIQHGVMLPNLLFNKLHPNVKPFYTNLEVLTKPKAWPELMPGQVRRVSVNSFGFGGANAHVILEQYVPVPTEQTEAVVPHLFTPFNFSAASEKSLRGILGDFQEYLEGHSDVSLQDLSFTLYARRTEHAFRTSISASSVSDLQAKIKSLVDGHTTGVRSKKLSNPVRTLGVFTGQGAQWPTMLRELILHSPYAKQAVQELDAVLQTLPAPERPDWSLMSELLADASTSRLDTALVAQPLCTVVQIILVDLLRAAGVKFHAVVGHSSGEIAAAYAAGRITRDDAIKIAYYRGYFTHNTPSVTPGAMMAAGTTVEDANELCSLPIFKGRLAVAAINSSTSVTISGDRDAIEQAKEILEDENKFARLLKVDKAYHSSHMVPCSEGYVEALKRCNIKPREGDGVCVWYSSTYENREMNGDGNLSGQYWADNMVRPVLFQQAVGAAVAGGVVDLAVEVGPHAALEGPAIQTIQEVQKDIIPYTGVIHRGKNDVEAVAEALGYIWSQFSGHKLDLRAFDALVSGGQRREMVGDLPTYHWDHSTLYWHSSRAAKAFLNQKNPPNPLLGVPTTDVMEKERRWKNLLKLNELPWANGHQLQGQVIYPATAYIATAVEAARFLVPDENAIAVIEVEDFSLGKPLVFSEGGDSNGIETVFTLSDITKTSDDTISAAFIFHACSSTDTEQLSTHATGKVAVILGAPSSSWLPARKPNPPNLVPIPQDRFYASLEPLGYSYSGWFRTLSSIQRRMDFSSALITVPPQDDEPVKMLLHPALLDSALQGIFLAYCWPGDGSLEQLHVPTGIRTFRVNVPACRQSLVPSTDVATSSQLTGNPLATRQLNGDVDIYAPDGTGLVQMECIKVVAFSEPTPDMDRAIFSEHKWGVASPSCELAMAGARATDDDYEFAYAMERVSIHYMKQMVDMFPKETRAGMGLEWHFECMFDFFEDVLATVAAGGRQCAKPEWVEDSDEMIEEFKRAHGHRVDMQLACAVGDNIAPVLRGETTILEHMTKDNLLNRFYEVGLGLKEFSFWLGKTVKQVVHRYPRMKILEIGKSTSSPSRLIMGDIGRSFASYTYTDISTGFFETAQDVFSAYKLIFKTLDVEKDVVQQGYTEGTYDLIVASLVLHATKDLNHTLSNARRLLKPGGQLIILEVSNNDVCRVGFLMCALPGWWLGKVDGRVLSPCVSTLDWHTALLRNGFSGIDSSTPEHDAIPYPLAVIVSQAVDDRVALLREPLSAAGLENVVTEQLDFVLIGGQTLSTIQLVQKIVRLLPAGTKHTVFKTLGDIKTAKITNKSVILVLTELDEPVFKRLTENTLVGLQFLFETQRTVLWITRGCRSENPYMNMSVGLGRSLVLENPDLTLQFLDLEEGVRPSPRQLLEALLRLRTGDFLEREGQLDNVLWTTEHELALENGETLLSRVYQNKSLNNRFNASKRAVVEISHPSSAPLTLTLDASSRHSLTRATTSQSPSEDTILLTATHSLLHPVFPTAYLTLGTSPTRATLVALTASNTSCALVPMTKSIEITLPVTATAAAFLTHLTAELLAASILSICHRDSTLLVHEPSLEVAKCLRETADGVTVYFSTSAASTSQEDWIIIDDYTPKRVVQAALPEGVSVFVDCATKGKATGVITSCLAPMCVKTTLDGLDDIQHLMGLFSAELGKKVLGGAVQRALAAAPSGEVLEVVPLRELVGREVQKGQAIVDWTGTDKVPVQVETVESEVKFRGDRTYVLFGLTSDLAQSICDWMAEHGARNIVLTSRNPKVEGAWVEGLGKRGVRLEAFANDITDKVALSALVTEIRRDWPPIAGVAHGAMVLDDISFFEMPFEKMQKVLGPKVQGAVYLDELFHDESLEFFVLFSSVTAIAGNRGQSAYTTANMFMSSLATQRRARGVAASILHIGAVIGVGYINRSFSDAIFAALRKTGFMMMSEREFHLCFGEAVVASNPRSDRNPEVITALSTIRSTEVQPPWAKFPRFQHCIQIEAAGDRKEKKKTATVSTRSRLLEATTPEEVFETVSDAFFQKLQLALHLPAETERSQVLALGLDDLGVDSLVAVEIRSWFLKEIETEIPVFKVLSGGSVTQLLEYAIENMPAKLAPNQNGETSDAGTSVSGDLAVVQLTPESHSSVPSIILTNDSTGASQSDGHSRIVSAATSQMGDEPEKALPSPVASVLDPPSPKYEKIVPISPGQSRFWFLKQLIEDQTTANNTIRVAIEGSIRHDSLEIAVRKIASLHEAFRTSFFINEDQKPVQAISETSRLYLERKIISDESQVNEEFDALKNHVYDIEHGECMRLVHLSLSSTKSYLLIGSHHIILDGISLEVFLNALQRAYNGQRLPHDVFQYSEYSEKIRHEISSGNLHGEINYWKTELANPPAPLSLLPFSATKSRTTLTQYAHTSARRTLPAALAKKIEKTCVRLKANVFHFYLGVFEVLLFKLLGTADVCIGMADANRWDDRVAQSIGMYLNLLPLRFHLDSAQSFEAVLKDTRRKSYLAMSHSRLPFDVLLDNIECERSTAFSPLFQAFINYRQGVSETRSFDGAMGRTEEIELPKAGYDISLDVIENPGGDTRVIIMLQRSLYGEEEAERVLVLYFGLLEEMCQGSGRSLGEISLFTEKEVEDTVKLGKGPVLKSTWPETLPGRIDGVIAKCPTAVAVEETSGQSWTYEELGAQVNGISLALVEAGVAKGTIVSVFQEASAQLVFSLLAILRLGAIYVPLDVNIPAARLQAMVAECKPAVVLVSTATATKAGDLGLPSSVSVLDVCSLPSGGQTHSVNVSASAPAAILFTSGTSGLPKGVVLSHGNFRNHVEALTVTHGFCSETVLQQSSVGFDMSLNQIFIALANGGTLVIVPEALRKDFAAVSQIILDNEITYTSATPSEYIAWLRHGSGNLLQSKSWSFATAGGEQFSPELLQAFRQLKGGFEHSFRVFNAYGPTEASFSSNELEVNLNAHSVTAGRTLPNYAVTIVDEDLRPVPAGFTGEICIAGAGVAIGYLNNTEETARKFTKTSFSDKAYRTGDKGVFNADGTLSILCRIDGDTQVKLRGLRIELLDIEQSILATANGQISDVVVTPRGSPTILVAHAVLSATAPSNAEQFLQTLAASLPLPQYMRPAVIVAVDRICLTSSGKIDRKALQALPLPASQATEDAAPLTSTEQRLASIWESVLPQGLHAITSTSDFFNVGGNSMLLIELRNLIQREFSTTLPLLRLFEHSTLSAMASAISSSPSATTSINWANETALSSSPSLPINSSNTIPPSHPPRTILLTGATGFLGTHLLCALLSNPATSKVHCLAVRSPSKLASLLAAHPEKLVVHSGDLSLPLLGLSSSIWDQLTEEADAIIHNGADVSFLKTYASLRAANVESTKALAEMAAKRKVPLHFISTGTVGKVIGGEELKPESLAAWPPTEGFADGYAATKWVGEVFLEKAGRELGVPIAVHRPSSITGEGAGDTDAVGSVLVKLVVDLDNLDGRHDSGVGAAALEG
ncbi:polyketide synthetase [Schizothecium vesticola]|uniref:Polyketide synthetase n=1 Tax=Schizothecium vesticola TaxID=314040 RepID=A0AA40ELC8_9PEZI|nr:polyketide synthetase [Schizothecium vesticola]